MDLKNTIDANEELEKDRYEVYCAKSDLNYLNSEFQETIPRFQQHLIIGSTKTGLIFAFALFLQQSLLSTQADSVCKIPNPSFSPAFLSGIFFGVCDLVFRSHHPNHFGFFKAITKKLEEYAENEIERMRNIFYR